MVYSVLNYGSQAVASQLLQRLHRCVPSENDHLQGLRAFFFLLFVLSARKNGGIYKHDSFWRLLSAPSRAGIAECRVQRHNRATTDTICAMSVYRVEASRNEAVGAATGTVNVLPTAVNFTGVVANGTSNWNSYRETDQDGNPVNYLRGRKLVGTPHSVPGHAAVVFERSEAGAAAHAEYTSVCLCDSVVLYEHQVKPSLQNDQVERLADWVGLTSYISDV